MRPFYPFVHEQERKKKEWEPQPLHVELYPPPPEKREEEEKEEQRVIIIEIL